MKVFQDVALSDLDETTLSQIPGYVAIVATNHYLDKGMVVQRYKQATFNKVVYRRYEDYFYSINEKLKLKQKGSYIVFPPQKGSYTLFLNGREELAPTDTLLRLENLDAKLSDMEIISGMKCLYLVAEKSYIDIKVLSLELTDRNVTEALSVSCSRAARYKEVSSLSLTSVRVLDLKDLFIFKNNY